MPKTLSDKHYRESKEDWEKRIFKERDKQRAEEDEADNKRDRDREEVK